MPYNIGLGDRLIRFVAGVVLLYFAFAKSAWWGWLGILPLITALISWCPLYSLLGFATCRKGVGGCGCGCRPTPGSGASNDPTQHA